MDQNIKGLTVEIGGDVSKLGAALNTMDGQLRTSGKELRQINDLLKLDPKNTTLLTQKMEVLGNQIAVAKKKVDALKNAEKQAADMVARGEMGEEEFRELQREVVYAEQKVKSLEAQAEKTQKALAEAGEAAEDAGKEFEKAGKKSSDAAKDTDRLKKSVDDLRDSYKDAKDAAADSVKEFGAAVGVTGGAIVAGGTAALMQSMSYEDALKSLQAQTGATELQMRGYKSAMDDLFAGGYGEDMDDLAASMAQVAQVTGETGAAALQTLTEGALTLRDTFGFDVAESLRAATMLEKQFGVTGEEAYNLITQGAQNGLNKNGDLLDVINEYGVHYAQLGFSAEEFFGSLQNGAEAGAFTVDKVGDTMKEFGIRIKDTSTTTTDALNLLGYALEDSEAYATGTYESLNDLQARFAEGGESAQSAMETVMTQLLAVDDKVVQNQIGVALFGTMWEDLGIDAVTALVDVNTSMDRTKSAMEDIKKIKYDSVSNDWKKLGRQVQTELVAPIGDKLLPVAKKFINYLSTNLEDLIPTVKTVGSAIAGMMIANKLTTMVVAIKKMVSAYKALKAATTAANAAMNSNVIGLVAGAVGALIGGLISLCSASDDAAEAQRDLANAQQEVLDACKESTREYYNASRERAEAIDAISEECDTYDDLWAELQTLVEKNGKVKDGYEERAEYIAGELSEAIGEEISLIDGEIQKYAELTETIDTLLLKQRGQRLLNSSESAYNTAVAEVNDTSYTTDAETGKIIYTEGSQAAAEAARADWQEAVDALEAYKSADAYEQALRDAFIEQKMAEGMDYVSARSALSYEVGKRDSDIAKAARATELALVDLQFVAEKHGVPEQNAEQIADITKIAYDAAAYAYDINIKQIKDFDGLEAALASGSAEQLQGAIESASEGMLTAADASISSLRIQQEEAAAAYETLFEWSQNPGSTVTQERLTEAFVLHCKTMTETYRKMLQDSSGATKAEIAAQEAELRAVLAESGTLTQDQITAILRLAADGAVDLGEMFGEGFALGMENALPKVEKAGDELGNAAEASLKNRLEVKSPSRVGRRIGAFFSEGVGLGIYDETESVAAHGVRLAERLSEAVSGGLARPTINYAIEASGLVSGDVADLAAICSRLERIVTTLGSGKRPVQIHVTVDTPLTVDGREFARGNAEFFSEEIMDLM